MKKFFNCAKMIFAVFVAAFLLLPNSAAFAGTIPSPRFPTRHVADQTPTYRWTRVSGATDYQYQLYKNGSLVYMRGALSSACTATVCSHTPVIMLNPGLYKWRVRARINGVWSTFSPFKPFYIVPAGVRVLNNYTTYEGYSTRYVVGEVFNNTANFLEWVTIAVNFFNNGQLVGTGSSYLDLDDLHPYEAGCFRIILSNAPAEWTTYSFEPVSYQTDGEMRPALTVTTRSGGVYSSSYYQILGQIRNDSAQSLSFVKAVATLYDANGRVVGCGYDYVNSDPLAPGQVSSFDIHASLADPWAVRSYYLQTDD